MRENRCVCCGEIIPEGKQVCQNCLVTVERKPEESGKLKPCPFCGGKAKYVYQMPYNAVKCTKCKVFGKTIVDSYEQQDGKEEAIAAWNRRAEDVH